MNAYNVCGNGGRELIVVKENGSTVSRLGC